MKTTRQVAKLLGVPFWKVQRWATDGKIQVEKFGSDYAWTKENTQAAKRLVKKGQ